MDRKITELPAASAITSDDLFAIVDDPAGTPITQKATASQLVTFISTSLTQVYTGASPPVAPDDPTRAALYYPTGGGSLLQWSIGTATWV